MTAPSQEFLGLQAALAGEYSLERELGRGGMGIVYLARDVQLDRHVAIKVLPSHLTTDESRERFLREARTAAGLSHPNIVPIHRVGQTAGFVFFVMTYVAGQTLGERLRSRGPLPSEDLRRVLREVAWALAYAHGRGVVHRDVKPDNILLDEESGRALVTDFGIARADTPAAATVPGIIMGTANFMSPEQARGDSIDGRSDLYSLGVVGFLAASGRLPLESSGMPALLATQATERALGISAAAPGIPTTLANAIGRCLQTEPADRFNSGEELAEALAPGLHHRTELPAQLRGWLGARNPGVVVYSVWSGLLGLPVIMQISNFISFRHPAALIDVLMLLGIAAAPLVPMVGFHVNQARRLFRAGFTLADLRGALDVADHERADGESLEAYDPMTLPKHLLRIASYTSLATAAILTFFQDLIRRPLWWLGLPLYQAITITAWIAAAIFLVAGNMNQVPTLPAPVSRFFRVGLAERLWRSRIGEWLAKRLSAPTSSRAVGAGVFHATEVALGAAAGDLFSALPKAYRDQLAGLPGVVSALEARAVSARAEIAQLEQLGRSAGDNQYTLVPRVEVARRQLAKSVAALESIRLDLLRLHAGPRNAAPLTTLLDAARLLGEDIGRIVDAEREVEQQLGTPRIGARRLATPA